MNDDTLILYYYKDGLSAAELRAMERELERDPALAERYRCLAHELDGLANPPDLPTPEGLEYRLQSTLARAARLEQEDKPATNRWLHHWSFLAGAGVTAALALGIGIGAWLTASPGSQPVESLPLTAQQSPQWSPAAFERGLQTYFRTSRNELAGLGNSPNGERTTLANALLQQNNLYAQLARQNGAPELARVLRSFEPILAQLAREDLSDEDVKALRAQLEFELSVMLTKIARGSSQDTKPNTQEI